MPTRLTRSIQAYKKMSKGDQGRAFSRAERNPEGSVRPVMEEAGRVASQPGAFTTKPGGDILVNRRKPTRLTGKKRKR